jgi:Aspartyl protease
LKKAYFDKKYGSQRSSGTSGPITRSQSRSNNISGAGSPAKAGGNSRRTPQQNSSGSIPGSFQGMLVADLEISVIADSGGDDNVISNKTLEKLVTGGCFIPLQPFKESVTLQLTVKGATASCPQKAKLPLLLKLRAGPLRLRNLIVLVMDGDFDEVLLGRPLLQEIGIDISARLNSRLEELQDADLEDLPVLGSGASGSLARLLLTGPDPDFHRPGEVSSMVVPEERTHASAEESVQQRAHPIPIGYAPVVHGQVNDEDHVTETAPDIPIGDEDPDLGRQALEERVAAAVQSGLSPTGAAELRSLVHEFSDTFALRVGSKPPAWFFPMTLDLLEGATPVLARPRPLSTEKRKFSKQFTDQLLTYGLAYRNPTSTWTHPVHIVDTPGPAR